MMTNEIDMRVGMDVAQAKAELESLKRSVSSFAAEVQATARNLQLKVTAQADTAKALAELATLKQVSGGIESIVKVSVDSAAAFLDLQAIQLASSLAATIPLQLNATPALAELVRVGEWIDNTTAKISIDAEVSRALSALTTLKSAITSTSATIAIDVNLNASQALLDLALLRSTPNISLSIRAEVLATQAVAELTALKTLARDTVMRVEVQADTLPASAALAAFRAGLDDETIRITVDVSGVVGAQGALDGVRNAVLGLGAAAATTLPILRDYNDELNRMQLAARAAAAEIRRAAAEQERLRRAGGGNGGGDGGAGGADNDGSAWRKHALAVANVAHEYSGLASRLLVVKSAMAVLSAAVSGAIPVLTQMAAVAGAAFGTALATANVAAVSKELENLARSTAISKQALQEWRLAARFEGVSADLNEFGDMSKVFSELDKQVKSLGTEDGKEFAASLKSIGLNAKDLKDAKADEALLKIGEALGKTKLNDAQKSTFLAGISDDAAKLLPLLEKQAIEFKEIRGYANSVGAIQSDAQLESMRLAN